MSKNKRLPLAEPDLSKCNHFPNLKKSTLMFLRMNSFTYPEHCYAVCSCCGEGFEFIKKDDGELVSVDDDEKK